MSALTTCMLLISMWCSAAPSQDRPTGDRPSGGFAKDGRRANLDPTSDEAVRIAELTKEIGKSTSPHANLYEERGDNYMATGQFEEAIKDYTKAIELTPISRTVVFLREKRLAAAIGKRDYVQAIFDAKAVAKASPPKAERYAILSLILSKSPDDTVRDPKAALDFAKRSASIESPDRDDAIIERALAAANAANGDFEAAIRHQKLVIEASKPAVRSDYEEELKAYENRKEIRFPDKP